MSNEEIKQRIQYLIEHGGVWDDPLDELRRRVRLLTYMTVLACTCGAIGVLELVLLIAD